MATLTVKVVTKEIETVASANGDGETRFKTMTESLVDIPMENSENSLSKEYSSADSGICVNKDKSDISVLTNDEDSEQENSPRNSQNTEKSLSQESSKSKEGHSQNNKLSQESKSSSCSKKSSVSSKSSRSKSSKHTDESSNSSYNSTLKGSQNINNNDEDSRSSVSSSSTLKSSQPANDKSDDESSRSSFKSSRKSLSQKHSQNTNGTEDNDSRSSFTSSKSKSTIKSSQPVRSDDEDAKSSFKSSNRNSSPQKQSQSTHLTEDNNSRSSVTNSQSTLKDSQPISDKSDDENSRSSFKSTNRKSTTPQKSENSGSPSKSTSNKSTPVKQSKKVEKPKKYFSIVDSDSEDDIVMKKFGDNDKHSDSDSSMSKSVKSPKSSKKSKAKNNRKLIDSDSDRETKSGNKSSQETGSDSDDSGSVNKKENFKSSKKSNKINDLIDSESDDENDRRSLANASSGEENDAENLKGKKKSEKKRTGSVRASKDKAMQEIHSETQRLIRESNLSLPYHRPKQRTLQEFLNRKKITTGIPKNLTCAEKVKMFPEMISKVVQEKEKEAELFYKSSDSEEDNCDEPMEINQIVSKPENQNNIQSVTSNSNNLDTQANIQSNEESQSSTINPLQKSPNFVSRKLFADDSNEPTDPENRENLNENNTLQKSTTNEEDLTMNINISHDTVSMSEEKNQKDLENKGISDENTESSEKKLDHDNSTEDMILNMSETEHDTSEGKTQIDNNEINNLAVSTNRENISMSEKSAEPRDSLKLTETSMIPTNNENLIKNQSKDIESSKNQSKTAETFTEQLNKSDELEKQIESAEDSEDPVLKLILESEEEEKTLDHNVLRDDFGLALDFDEPKKKQSLKEKILANALKNKPMIKSSPGSVIDLTSPGQLKEGAIKLLDRFVRHSTVTKPKVDTVSEVNILRTEGTGDDIKIIEEILPFNKTIIEDDPKKESIPGEKLKKLRQDLKLRIANARDEEWKHREEQEQEDEEEDVGKGKGDDFYADLPDEEEILDDEESAESEPEENDIPMVENKRKTCAFGDEEAEESDNDGEEVMGENNIDDEDEEEEENEDDEEEEEEEDEEEKESDGEEEEEDESMKKPKKLKRIIQAFDDDSNQSSSSVSNDANAKLQTTLDRTKTDEDMFATQASNPGYASEDTENDNFMLFQRDRCGSDSRSQACKTPLPKHQVLSMISPVAQLTALNTSLDSAKKSTSKTNNFNLGKISVENTPCENSERPQNNCNLEKMISLQKKLFDDPPEAVNEQELLEICSGKFTDTQSSGVPALSSQNGVTDSQLMSICSGAFVTQSLDMKKLESNENLRNQVSDSQIMQVCSGEFNTLPFDAKKLESGNEPQNKVTDSQIMDVLSGGFATQDIEAKKLEAARNTVTDSQIMEICSGGFTQAVDPKRLDVTLPTLQLNDETSQDVTLILEDDEDSKLSPTKTCSSVKRSDESMFSSDSKSPVKDPSFENGNFKNPMEAWLKKVTEKSLADQKSNNVTDSQIRDMCSGDFPSQTQPQKSNDVTDSQIRDMCSGDFPSQTQPQKSNDVTDSQIRDMCSGDFPSQSQAVNLISLEKNDLLLNQNENLQDFNLTLDENTKSPVKDLNSNKKKAKNPMEAWLQKCNDKAGDNAAQKKENDLKELEKSNILQLENDASRDLNVAKDEKAKDSVEQDQGDVKLKKAKNVDEREGTWKILSSSDDEEKPKATKLKKKKLKKKKAQKLELSDDEDENPNEFSEGEESVLEDEEEEEEKFIDYDSDENEMIVVSKKEIKKVAKKFVENEAELSESDWDSADEDEQDLDKFEAEEGDAEEIDENEMKDQLDRIHMKQVMDDDQRDVRMLQEIFFDDGDLHSEGAGRERKFKWKNIDSQGNDDLGPRVDDNIDLMEDEVDAAHEAQMRKMRHEKQRFLEEKEKSMENIVADDFSESQLFNCGLKVVTVRSSKTITEEQKLTKSNSTTTKSTTLLSSFSNLSKTSLTSTKSLSFSNTRGSFLSRGDATLIRIAQSLPETNNVTVNIKRKGKFVFEHLSPSVSKTAKDDSEQENDDTPTKEKPDKTRKRKMFSSQGQTPRTSKKLKVDDRTAGKKLF